MKLTLGKKLAGVFAVIIGVILLTNTVGIGSSYSLNKNAKTINEQILPKVETINDLQALTQKVQETTLRHIMSKDRSFEEKYEQQLLNDKARAEKLLGEYKNMLRTEKEQSALRKVNETWEEYTLLIDEVVKMSIDGNDGKAAEKNFEAIILQDEIQAELEQLSDNHRLEATEIETQGAALYKKVLAVMAFSMLAAILISLYFTWYLRKTIQRPILFLSEKLKGLAQGDLTIEPALIRSKDEIGELGSNFNLMLEQLRKLITELHHHIETVASTSSELASSADETSRAASQIAESIMEVSERAAEQRESAKTSSQVAAEMNEGMSQAAASIHSVSDYAGATAAQTQTGKGKMKETVAKMDEIYRSSRFSVEAIASLHGKSAQISSIVSLINNVAKQTNLLALNAAIEAARAGEHGKGFAVVAGEVSKLAGESEAAAQRISDIIGEIQLQVDETSTAIERSGRDISGGIELAKESGQRFEEIGSMIREISGRTEEVTAISEEVSAGTVSMQEMIEAIASKSEEVDRQTQTVAAAAEQQNATMEEISASASLLSAMSDKLREMVSAFKLS